MSLTRLVETTLQRPLPYSEAMSDWSQRPIQPEQLAYACSDVLNLHDLRETLTQRPRDPRLPDLHTCSQAILEETLKRPKPENLWREFRATSALDSRGREILRRGCMIRRELAQSENRRERQVCSDASLVDLAKRQPLTLEALNQPRHVPRKLRGQLGETLVECVQTAMAMPIEECPAPLQTQELEPECLFLLSAWGEHCFRSRGLSPRLLLPESVKTRIALEWARGESPQFQMPWRKQAAQKELDELVSGGFRIGSNGLEKA